MIPWTGELYPIVTVITPDTEMLQKLFIFKLGNLKTVRHIAKLVIPMVVHPE